MDAKLLKIRDLINEKERIEAELTSLLGGEPVKKQRGRPRKANGEPPQEQLPIEQ